MKQSSLIILVAALVFAVPTILNAQSKKLGQRQQQRTPAPLPTPSKTNAPRDKSNSLAEPQQTPARTPREMREQAYAKLLEGQRFYLNARLGDGEGAVRLAQQAFRQAAQLDPTLSEAHTALAEIALIFPPQDLDLAAREATTAVQIDRNNVGGHRLISRVYAVKSGLGSGNLNKESVTKAIAELREVVRLDSSDAEGWALLGEFYLALGHTNEAIDAWTRWSAAPLPSDSRFYQAITQGRELTPASAAARLGQALLMAGRNNEAVETLRRAVTLDPDNRDYFELLIKALETAGGSNASLTELQRLVAANPTNVTAVLAFARSQASAGRVNDAATTLRAGINARPRNDREKQRLQLALSEIYTNATRYTDAINVFEEMLKDHGIGNAPLTSPDDKDFAADVLQQIIGVQKSAGLMTEAASTIERMRRVLGLDDPAADIQAIVLLREQGKRREALEAIRSARQRFPQEPEFLKLESQTLADLGNTDDAAKLLRSQLTGALTDFDIYLRLSNLYSRAARNREAVETARKALELAQSDKAVDLAPSARSRIISAALITLSTAQERAGDMKGSEESLRSVLAKEPDNAVALNNLGYFLVERNERLSEALELIQRAVRSDPSNSSFLDSLGWAYFKMGRLDEAEKNLTEAARRDQTSANIQEHLGDLYERRGRLDLARAAWQRALTLAVEADDIVRLKAKLGGEKKR